MSTTSTLRQPRQCRFIKANGEQCRNSTKNASGFCQAHPDGRGSITPGGGQMSRRDIYSSKSMSILRGGPVGDYDSDEAAPFAAQSELVSAADRSTLALIDDLNRKPRSKIRLKAGQWFDSHRAKLLSEAMDSHADLALAKRGYDARLAEVDGWIRDLAPREPIPQRGDDGLAHGTRFNGSAAIGDLTEEQIAEASRTRIDPVLAKAKFPNLYSQCCTGKDESIALYHKGMGKEAVQDWKDTHCPNGELTAPFAEGRGSVDDLGDLMDYRAEIEGYNQSIQAAQVRLKKAVRDTVPPDAYLIPSNRNPDTSVRVNASFKPGRFDPHLASQRLSRRSLAQVTVIDLDPEKVRRIAPQVWEKHRV